ncbi:MAG: hypothetical protein ACTSW1_07690 [Candidatus Hodarchaeales archaeon]
MRKKEKKLAAISIRCSNPKDGGILENLHVSPCYECLCVPICKHRTYEELIKRCLAVFKFIYYNTDGFGTSSSEMKKKVYLDLKPIRWYGEDKFNEYYREIIGQANEFTM